MFNLSKAPVGKIVDIQGDGVWPEISREIIENLLEPYFDIEWHPFDLSLKGRDSTQDKVMDEVVSALNKSRTGVKGPTITPTDDEVKKYGLSQRWKSPNEILRRRLHGIAIFRSPIEYQGMKKNAPLMNNVHVARFAVGGIYEGREAVFAEPGTLTVTFKKKNGAEVVLGSKDVKRSGVAMLTTEDANDVRDYAYKVFKQALLKKMSVALATKHTVNPVYDGLFRQTFRDVFAGGYKDQFAAGGLQFREDLLIDAAAAGIISGKYNNYMLVFKNYDGDVISDEVAGGHLSLGMMDSCLVTAGGVMLTDPPHGTAPDLEPAWHKEGKLLANPTAYIFAYADGIIHQAAKNKHPDSVKRAELLKQAVIKTIEAGYVTGDLRRDGQTAITAQKFIGHVRDMFEREIRLSLQPRQEPPSPGMTPS